VSQPWMRPPRARATANHVGSNPPTPTIATAVPRMTAVYDQSKTGIRRNSRNQPFAVRSKAPPPLASATILTISIVILERLFIGCSMRVPQPTLSPNGWGRHSMDRRLWYLIAGTRGGINRARIFLIIHDRPPNANDPATKRTLDYKTVSHHLGVLVFAALFLLENLAAMYFYFAWNESLSGTGYASSVAMPMLLLNAVELVAFSTLLLVSWR